MHAHLLIAIGLTIVLYDTLLTLPDEVSRRDGLAIFTSFLRGIDPLHLAREMESCQGTLLLCKSSFR
jgi:hypothetical protein